MQNSRTESLFEIQGCQEGAARDPCFVAQREKCKEENYSECSKCSWPAYLYIGYFLALSEYEDVLKEKHHYFSAVCEAFLSHDEPQPALCYHTERSKQWAGLGQEKMQGHVPPLGHADVMQNSSGCCSWNECRCIWSQRPACPAG